MGFFYFAALQEYCNMKEFVAECPPNQVILMDVARYGRMRVGNCVHGNYGYIGCYIDVRSRMDQLCSGRHRCEFQVPDPQMYERRSCPGDFTSHLEASYSCVSGKWTLTGSVDALVNDPSTWEDLICWFT